MKKLLAIIFYFPLICAAQKLELNFNGKTFKLENGKVTELKVSEPTSGDQTIFLNFKVEDNNDQKKIVYKFQDRNDGTASINKDYVYTDNSLTTKTIDKNISAAFTISVRLLADIIPEVDEYINLSVFQEIDGEITTYPIKLVISDATDPSKAKADTAKWELRIVTGSNFDFFEAPTFKNFAGQINLFVPNIWNDLKLFKSKTKLGFQFGIYNFRYFEADSSKGYTRRERYLEKPNISSLEVGSKYIEETYALDTKTDQNLWGWYLNPMIAIDESNWFSVYLNLHLEGMVRTTTVKPTKANRRIDTLTVTQADITQNITLNRIPIQQRQYSKNVSYESYLGLGLPLRLNVKEKKFAFNADPTLGAAFFDNTFSKTVVENGIIRQLFTTKRKTTPFFLFKGQLLTKVAPVDLALGWELRKVINYDTYLAMYLGATLSLDKLKK
ncbi:MAG: hypothetical protein REI64_10780 [Pedobacter sp.]|uniref:hypothetical protein n=1 Tax=Pedobacter sp. TaxID=1411316 RepID=UPI00280843DA|nr:hypothetical protein [Pedobacter sp.]MDQ8005275.1 hypothetical protein [Pedobacter sp.]